MAAARYCVTNVPMSSPCTAASKLPFSKKLNTMIGIWLSMQSENAAPSITRSERCKACHANQQKNEYMQSFHQFRMRLMANKTMLSRTMKGSAAVAGLWVDG